MAKTALTLLSGTILEIEGPVKEELDQSRGRRPPPKRSLPPKARRELGPVYERLFEPEQDARQVNDGGVAGGEFFVAGGDGAGFLPASHEAFDNVAAGDRPRGRSRRLARRLRVRAAGSRGVRPGARWPRARGARTGFLGP